MAPILSRCFAPREMAVALRKEGTAVTALRGKRCGHQVVEKASGLPTTMACRCDGGGGGGGSTLHRAPPIRLVTLS